MNLRYSAGLFLILILLASCKDSTFPRPADTRENPQPAFTPQRLNNVEDLEKIFTREPSLSYQGYTVIKRQRTVDFDGLKAENSYALLTKGAKTVATFDGLHHPAGSAMQFGLFSFLHGETKQLIVEQSVPRNESHWIVQLTPDFKIIFDSSKWGVDRELIQVDVNQDGTFEFTKMLTVLYDFHNLPLSEAPLIPILFMYNRDTAEYIPGNQTFQEYALRGIEDEIRSLDRSNARTELAGVLRILMRYIYAGKREEGWAFYEKEYKFADKELIKSEIVSKLASEPVYNFVYPPKLDRRGSRGV